MSNLTDFLTELHTRNGSDLILKEDRPPLMRFDGKLIPSKYPVQTRELLWENLSPILSEWHVQRLEAEKEIDLGFEIAGLARFRVNVFYQRSRVGAVIRAIPLETPTIDGLKLPAVLKDVAGSPTGIVLVTGPTGSGKSTTLAAVVQHINLTRAAHIITIEDPIEFVYTDAKATITQRGIGEDTLDAGRALRAALRQNPDVILAGEMRDRETMELALHAAETGHLVLSTLHTNDAKQSITRIIDAFPPENRQGLLRMLSICLRAVVSQRLIPRADGSGRIAAHEVMIVSPTIQQLIEKGAVEDMAKAIASSSSYYRMQSFNQSLAELVLKRLITPEAALENSSTPGDLKLLLKGFSRQSGHDAGPSSSNVGGGSEAPPTPPPAKPEAAPENPRVRKRPARPARPSGRLTRPPQQRRPRIERGFDFG